MSAIKEQVNVNGIATHVTPNPGKPLIMLVRMASQEIGIWDPIWSDLSRHFAVANFDLGQLPAAKQADDPAVMFRALAAACIDVAAGLGHERFHLLGWSGGTQIALRCLVDFPGRLRSAILIDPFYALPDMRHVERAIEFKRVLFSHPDRSVYASYWIMAGLSDRFIEAHFDKVESLVATRVARDSFVRTDVDRFIAWVRALRHNWVSDTELASIRDPTLILATELDRWNAGPSIAMAQAVHKRIPMSRFEVLTGVGGLFPIEAPEKFMQAAAGFISETSTPFSAER